MACLNLFVYGTLMSGFRSNQFIPKNATMEKGMITGNLFHYIVGYPIVQIPEKKDQVIGCKNCMKDIEQQDKHNWSEPINLEFDINFGRVYGELYKIPFETKEELTEILNKLDGYEGFDPSAPSNLYLRSLVPVKTADHITWAWVYNMKELPVSTVLIRTGNWMDCFYTTSRTIRPEVNAAIPDLVTREYDWV